MFRPLIFVIAVLFLGSAIAVSAVSLSLLQRSWGNLLESKILQAYLESFGRNDSGGYGTYFFTHDSLSLIHRRLPCSEFK